MNFKSPLAAVLSVILLNTGVTHAALPLLEETPSESRTILAQTQNNAEAFYQKAKQELPEDYYMVYRIIERLARANQLNNLPWRVHISPDYDVNAFATDVNLVAFFGGLLDQIDGDPHAIACVVAHEMAHHTKNHIAVGAAERERILQQLRAEAVEEVSAEEEDLRADLQGLGMGEWVTSGAGTLANSTLGGRGGGLIGTGINILRGVLQNNKQRRIQAAVERINNIYAEKEAKVEAEWQALNHRQEFEADEAGYLYMVRAGFNPQGCQTVMTVLSRLGVTASETHPATPERLAAIQSFATQYPTATLVEEGKANLAANPNPLTYDLSRDQATLRINSQTGSRNFDEAFPDF